MRFALEHCFLLGHLGFTATQTALPTAVISSTIIINKIPVPALEELSPLAPPAQAFCRLGCPSEQPVQNPSARSVGPESPAALPPEHTEHSSTSNSLLSCLAVTLGSS